jgi:hypothetical protein
MGENGVARSPIAGKWRMQYSLAMAELLYAVEIQGQVGLCVVAVAVSL